MEKIIDREYFTNRLNNIGALGWFLEKDVNKEYLDFINSNIDVRCLTLPVVQRLWHYLNNAEPQLCICGEFKGYISYKKGYRKTCCNEECYKSSRKEANLEKYGVENPMQNKEIRDKGINTLNEKYGVTNPMLVEEVRNKQRQTMMKNHGVKSPLQNKEILEKAIESFRNNPNHDKIVEDRRTVLINKPDEEKDEIYKKVKQTLIDNFGSYEAAICHRVEETKKTNLERYGVESHFKTEKTKEQTAERNFNNSKKHYEEILPECVKFSNIIEQTVYLFCDICEKETKINTQLLRKRIRNNIHPCLNCNPILHGTSEMEKTFAKFVSENYKGEICRNDKRFGLEMDIFLPNVNLAIEFNGLYWHSELYKDNNFHLKKTNLFSENGIRTIHVWEDDWLFREEIVKSMIKNALGSTSNKIYARKTIIKIVSNKVSKKFLEENHLQGAIDSKISIGLFFGDELASLMCFGELRSMFKQKKVKNEYELLRFCNKINTIVVGGASKLFSYFVKTYNPVAVTSYCDISRGTGKVYEELGFTYLHISKPNYYYIVDGIRRNRYGFRKDILVKQGYDSSKTEAEIMFERGIYRIYDCGSSKYIWRNRF